jgi:DNA-binding MarR family transcriptional regulator
MSTGSEHPPHPESVLSTAEKLAVPLARVYRAQQRLVLHSLSLGPLTINEVYLLLLIESQGGMKMGEAAARLSLAPNTLTPVVKRLHELGLLERRTDPADRRVTQLSLTQPGADRLNAWRRARSGIIADGLTGLTTAEQSALVSSLPALAHLATLLEEQLRDIGPR